MTSRSNYNDTVVELSQAPGESNVPNNPVAKLMYYLYCIAQTLNLPNEASFNRHSDYANFSGLGRDEKKELVSICDEFNPDLLVGKVFFRSESASHSNEFTELSVTTIKNAAKSVEIGGERYLVIKIMTFKQSWLDTYYMQPLSDLRSELVRPSVLQFWRSQLTRGLRTNGVLDSSSPTARCCCLPRPVEPSQRARGLGSNGGVDSSPPTASCCSPNCRCEIKPVDINLAVTLIGSLMIVLAVGDLIATSVNIAHGGADKIGSGIWLGFQGGLCCGAVMVSFKGDYFVYSTLALAITLTAFFMHLAQVGYLFGYGMSATARASNFDFSSLPVVNGVEAFFGSSLLILDTITVILILLGCCKCL